MVAVTGACHGLLSGQSEVTARISVTEDKFAAVVIPGITERKQGTYKFEEMSVA